MNPEQVSKSEFKARALEFLRKVESSGQSLIVTDHGKPSIEVRRFQPTERSPLALLKGTVTHYIDPMEPAGTGDWESLQ